MKQVRKTKIICTLGPSTEKEGVLEQLMLAGMNVARFNFSHGDHEEQLRKLERVKRIRKELWPGIGSPAIFTRRILKSGIIVALHFEN